MDTRTTVNETDVEALVARLESLRSEIGKVIIGQDETVEQLMVGLLAGGHCLLEGVPGLAKTLMIRSLAVATELSFKRIQFTPDLMPSDIVGTEILEEDHGTGKRAFRFNRGPIFANLVLADEINRSPPKTQAALLEAMQELEVTYGGETYRLDRPFFVLATQNPIEQTGTYPLPEAQLDRFLLQLHIDYPTLEEEKAILATTTSTQRPEIEAVIGADHILRAQQLTREVHISGDLVDYVTRLVRTSRPSHTDLDLVRGFVEWGAGPRAGQALILAAKAHALLHGRLAVTLDSLQQLTPPVFRHRILVNFKGQAEGLTAEDVTCRLLESVPPPTSALA